MIIECINCHKKFTVNSELIPEKGRTIQCGSCNHVWFFQKKDIQTEELSKKTESITSNIDKESITPNIYKELKKSSNKPIYKKDINNNSGSEIVKYEHKINFTFGHFLSYTIVSLITFVALIILVDTFKSPLYDFFPNLEFFLFSFFEILKDIQLFIKDLI